ncbi:MAG: dihydroorotate dehydrogenase [Candidatus Bathyarchaeia archaeon]
MELSSEIAGLRLKSPLLLSSGILGLDWRLMKRALDSGAAAVITKSLTLAPRKGFPNPTIVEVRCGLLNAMGIPNPGIKEFSPEIGRLKGLGAIVIASIAGGSPGDYAEAAGLAEEAGADAIEANVSCPHVGGVADIGQDPSALKGVVAEMKGALRVPLIVKLSPNVTDIGGIAKAAEDAGADAISAINTVKGLSIDIYAKRPILSAGTGGLSGPAIKPIALRCVYEIRRAVDLPIIGCGGILDWADAIEFLMAGANALGIGSAIYYRDVSVFGEILEGMKRFMRENGYRSVKELIGLAHRA